MSLVAALQFLTRVPIRLRREPSLAKMVAWFPVAGAIIGTAVGGVAAGMWQLTTPLVAAGVAVIVGLLITGAFHEDGLGDIADAFGGGWTIERRLEILKDSRHGTYGVSAICASIVLRTTSLGAMPGPLDMFTAAVAAHTMARVAAVGMAGTMKLASNTGLGADYGRSTTPLRALVGCSAGVGITTLAIGWWAAPLVVAAGVAAAGTGLLARRKIGGISGDVLGAAEQVAECLCLVVLSGLALHR